MLDYLESHRGPADKYLTNAIKISRDSCMTAVWDFGKYRIEMRHDSPFNDISYIERSVQEFENLKNMSIREINYKLYQNS